MGSYKVLKPSYYKNFECVGSDCEDTCCKGWEIHVDKRIYDVYKSSKNTPITDILENNVHINKERKLDFEYGIIELVDGMCPFFSEDRLCSIYTHLGKENMSYVCREYPRTYNMVDKVIEKSINTSCIEACKLILLNKGGIEFNLETEELSGEILFEKIIDTTDNYINYKYFNSIRNFSIEIIQNRNFCIEDRLILLGLFFESIKEDTDVDELINIYRNDLVNILNDEKSKNLKHSDIDAKIIFFDKIFSYIVENREITNERYLLNLEKLIHSLNMNSKSIEERKKSLLENFSYYEDFIKDYDYFYENYLVNYIFSKNIIATYNSLYRVYIDLLSNFFALKLSVIGVCLYERENMNIDKLLNVFQSFSITINHGNLPIYIDDYLNFSDEKDIFNIIITMI